MDVNISYILRKAAFLFQTKPFIFLLWIDSSLVEAVFIACLLRKSPWTRGKLWYFLKLRLPCWARRMPISPSTHFDCVVFYPFSSVYNLRPINCIQAYQQWTNWIYMKLTKTPSFSKLGTLDLKILNYVRAVELVIVIGETKRHFNTLVNWLLFRDNSQCFYRLCDDISCLNILDHASTYSQLLKIKWTVETWSRYFSKFIYLQRVLVFVISCVSFILLVSLNKFNN